MQCMINFQVVVLVVVENPFYFNEKLPFHQHYVTSLTNYKSGIFYNIVFSIDILNQMDIKAFISLIFICQMLTISLAIKELYEYTFHCYKMDSILPISKGY